MSDWERQDEVISERLLGFKLREIASRWSVSVERVRQIEATAENTNALLRERRLYGHCRCAQDEPGWEHTEAVRDHRKSLGVSARYVFCDLDLIGCCRPNMAAWNRHVPVLDALADTHHSR